MVNNRPQKHFIFACMNCNIILHAWVDKKLLGGVLKRGFNQRETRLNGNYVYGTWWWWGHWNKWVNIKSTVKYIQLLPSSSSREWVRSMAVVLNQCQGLASHIAIIRGVVSWGSKISRKIKPLKYVKKDDKKYNTNKIEKTEKSD